MTKNTENRINKYLLKTSVSIDGSSYQGFIWKMFKLPPWSEMTKKCWFWAIFFSQITNIIKKNLSPNVR